MGLVPITELSALRVRRSSASAGTKIGARGGTVHAELQQADIAHVRGHGLYCGPIDAKHASVKEAAVNRVCGEAHALLDRAARHGQLEQGSMVFAIVVPTI